MRIPPIFAVALSILLLAAGARAAITISNLADKTKYDAPLSFTITPDPNAAMTTATLDGVAVAVGSAVNVSAIGYHELRAESRTAGGTLVDSRTVRFIARNPARFGTEDGIPTHTPARTVPDAPSAFAGGTLKIIAPAAWPAGLPIPLAARLVDGANEALWLNGVVALGGFPRTPLSLRRGWGSVVAPAATAGTIQVNAFLNGLAHNPAIVIEAAPVFTAVSGTISANTFWPPNSRIHVTGGLTVATGATLTVGAGTIVKIAPAVEIVINGALQINGTESSPVVFTPNAAGTFWGGLELPTAASVLRASHTIFTGAGEDLTWFQTHSGYVTHRDEQALFLVAGSGAGTSVGAQLHLTDCYCFDLRGQQMNARIRTWVDLQRTLMQRCITGGELNGSRVTIDRSALIEFPSETGDFADADNDALYLTSGDLAVTNSVIGFTKDDGIDSGGNGGDNPFTAATDVTPFLSQNNWYEGIFHEANALSGTRNFSSIGCVFLDCGQGVEVGYSASASADGPNAVVDDCLFVNNMVAVRWGDNYGSGYVYNAAGEVKNSLLLNSAFRDAFSGQWHPTQANAWIYQTTATNTFGRPYFNVHDSLISRPDPLRHPANSLWNPASSAHAARLEPFMPVPGSNVGVAISTFASGRQNTAAYPGTFTVRLSTFSSQPVSVSWAVLGKADAFADTPPQTLGSSALVFAPGETIKMISAPLAAPGDYGLLHVSLTHPVNAEVTGEAIFLKPTVATTEPLIATASDGWRYRETRSEPLTTWKQIDFDDSAPEWLSATLPAGFGVSGVTFGTSVNGGSATDRTRTFYFRKKFTVADPANFDGVTLRLRRDDAAVVWINGAAAPSVVSADGTFAGPYSYAMTGVPNSTNTNSFLTYTIAPAAFIAGQNIIAIELHQTSLTSDDLVLDLALTANLRIPFQLDFTCSGQAMLLWWPGPNDILERSPDLVNWLPTPFTTGPVSVSFGKSQEFFRLRR